MPNTITRRDALATGGGLVLAFSLPASGLEAAPREQSVNGWFQIAPSGDVAIYVNSTDIGQGSQSGIAQVLADELGVDWNRVRVGQAPVERAFFNNGDYSTGGSGAIAGQWDALRHAGAQARTMLVEAAARKWRVDPHACTAESGVVRHGSASATYGELAPLAAKLPPPPKPVLKTSAQWKLIGKSVPRTDIPSKVNGRAQYAIDVQLPGMLNAVVAQCPFFGGRLVGMNEAGAKAVKGVRKIVRLPAWTSGDFTNMPMQETLAVIADRHWQAEKAMAALAPKWAPPAAPPSTDKIYATLRSDAAATAKPTGDVKFLTAVRTGQTESDQRKRVDAAFASHAKIIDATYEVPFIAHTTMEPMTAVAQWRGKRLQMWSGTQGQVALKQAAGKRFGIPESDIDVITTFAGGGFGRRYYPDSPIQAATLAQIMKAPVKVIWTRSEDIQHDLYRPPAVARCRAAIGGKGDVEAVRTRQGRICRFGADARYSDLQYEWPAMLAEFVIRPPKPVSVPFGAWRSVEDSPQYFFIESFVDELAHAVGADPIAYRKRLLRRNSRALRLLDALARLSDWNRQLPKGSGRGVAITFCNDSIATQVVEVSVQKNALKLERVVCAFDCGTAVNPDSIAAQGESSIVYGLTAALFGEITIKGGRVEQANFDSYRALQLAGCPAIDIHILESREAKIGGVGEPMTAPVAPALMNAIFAATGKRIRKLPLTASGMTLSA